MRAKRFLLLSIIFFMLFLLTPSFALAASDKYTAAVKKEVKAYFKDIKAYKPAKIDKHFKTPLKNKYIGNPKVQKLIRKMHKHTKYEITSISIKGNTATVKVDVAFYDAMDATKYAYREYLNDCLKTNEYHPENVLKYMKDYYESDYIVLTDTTFKIPLVKVKGKWKIKKLTSYMYDVLDCGVLKTIDYCGDHPFEVLFGE